MSSIIKSLILRDAIRNPGELPSWRGLACCVRNRHSNSQAEGELARDSTNCLTGCQAVSRLLLGEYPPLAQGSVILNRRPCKQASYCRKSLIDGRGRQAEAFQMKPESKYHRSIERETWFRAIPGDELVDGKTIRSP